MVKEEIVKVKLRGARVLNSSLINKGTGFSQEERDALGLNGLLPPCISTLEAQILRSYQTFSNRRSTLEKYESLVGLLSRNELLFYQFISRYAAEILPIIYTPTVGEAATEYSRIYFHQRGLYISYPLKDRMDEVLRNYSQDDVEVIVVTDGERILGLGDQGIGGMTIPIGKLSLYTLFGGIHPAKTLPIILDVGTNNQHLLNDRLYLGWRHERIRAGEYDEFVDQFIKAVKKRFPKVLLQWEDFGKDNARKLLDRYRKEILSFNDDIQGTAAVTLGGLFSAIKVAGSDLLNQRIVLFGGGSAGTGIADMLVKAMVNEGMTKEDACRRIYLIDVEGLIHFASHSVNEAQKPYAQPQSALKNWNVHSDKISLADVVSNAHPTILIGVSAQGGAFTKEIIEKMALNTKRPIIFPLSNPTSKSECTVEEAVKWTKGRAIIATGSPFDPVEYEGKVFKSSQCNNVYIFPGLGLGAIAAEAREITDGMFLAAAESLADFSPAIKDPTAPLFPPIAEVKKVSHKIALAVGMRACEEGVSSLDPSVIGKRIEEIVWEPRYPKYIAD